MIWEQHRTESRLSASGIRWEGWQPAQQEVPNPTHASDIRAVNDKGQSELRLDEILEIRTGGDALEEIACGTTGAFGCESAQNQPILKQRND
jgi:hypothetical protein